MELVALKAPYVVTMQNNLASEECSAFVTCTEQ